MFPFSLHVRFSGVYSRESVSDVKVLQQIHKKISHKRQQFTAALNFTSTCQMQERQTWLKLSFSVQEKKIDAVQFCLSALWISLL